MKTLILCGRAGAGKDTVANILALNCKARTYGQAIPLKEFAEMVFGFTRDQLYGESEKRNAVDPRPLIEVWSVAQRRLPGVGPHWLSDVLGTGDPKIVRPAMGKLYAWFDFERKHSMRHGTLVPRRILQTLGTDYGRNHIGEDVWINYAAERCKSYAYADLVIITDGRFPNEAEAIQAKGGAAWLIETPPMRYNISAGTAEPIAHASERMLDAIPRERFNYIITNPKDGDFKRLEGQVLAGLSQLTQKEKQNG